MSPLRLGLVGAGRWGRNYIRTIGGLAGVRLARLGTRDPEGIRLTGADCKISANWRDLIDAGDLDGLIVATPAPLHAEMALAAIDAGLPVLVEKPMTLGVDDAEEVVEHARTRGAIVRVDHIHLYGAAWQALKRETASLGPVHAIDAAAGGPGPVRPSTPMIWDWAPHDVAMCIDLLGDVPETVSARRAVEPEGAGETINAELAFGDVTASLRLSNADERKTRRFAVTFDDAALVYDDTRADKLCRGADPDRATEPVALEAGLPLEHAIGVFADAIAKGEADYADAELGLDVVRTIARLEAAFA